MKKIRMIAILLVMAMCLQTPAVSMCVEAATTTTTKKGLVEKNGKYYFYYKGKKIKNKWKTIRIDGKAYKYYFGKNGAAYAGKVITSYGYKLGETLAVKKISGKSYGFNAAGQRVKGIQVSYDTSSGNLKFYAFSSKGVLNKTKTAKLRKAAKRGADWAALKKLLGKPAASEYAEGCNEEGLDGIQTYKNFTVTTHKYPDGREIVYEVIQ